MKKLIGGYMQIMTATIWSRIFCLPICSWRM